MDSDIAAMQLALNNLSGTVVLHVDDWELIGAENEAAGMAGQMGTKAGQEGNGAPGIESGASSTNALDSRYGPSSAAANASGTDSSAQGDANTANYSSGQGSPDTANSDDSGCLAALGNSDDNDAIMQDMLDMLSAVSDAIEHAGALLQELPDDLDGVTKKVADMAGTFEKLSDNINGSIEKLGEAAEKGKEGKSAFHEFAEKLDDLNHVMEFAKNLEERFALISTVLKDAKIATAIAEGFETAATIALDVALIAIPFIGIAAAVMALTTAFSSLGKSTKDVKLPDVTHPGDTKGLEQPHDLKHPGADDVQDHAGDVKNISLSQKYTHDPDVNKVDAVSNSNTLSETQNEQNNGQINIFEHTNIENTGTDNPVIAGKGKENKKGKKRAASEPGGSNNQKVININYNSPLYKVDHQSFQTVKDAIDDFEPKIKEAMLRILASVPGIQ
jgi:uncharacterized protein YoxC